MARKSKSKELFARNSVIVFDPSKIKDYPKYRKYYKKLEGRLFVYLGDVVQAPGHAIILDMDSCELGVMWHTDNFRLATDEEF